MALSTPVDEIVRQSSNPLLSKHILWERVPLADLCEVLNGFAFKSSYFNKERGTPLIRIRDVGKDSTDILYDSPYEEQYVIKAGDLLIGMDGDFNSARWKGPEALLNQRVCKVELKSEHYFAGFLEHVLPGYLQAINDKTSSVTVKHLSSKSVKEIPLPLPPLNEQRRIVGKIEELFTKLDAGVRSLEQARALLKSYRRSVLKAAVEGELSREWREAHRTEATPASALFQPQEDADGLPNGWVYVNLVELAADSKDAIKRGPFGSAIKKEFFVPTGYKVYEQKNAIYDNCSLGSYYIDESKFRELSRFRVQPGDVLMSCSGTIGKVTVVPEDYEEGVINQALLKITLDDKRVLQHYFKYLFRVKLVEILEENTRGSAMKNIASVKTLKGVRFPLPSLQEQRFLLGEIERCFSVLGNLETALTANFRRASVLHQSILKEAFSGRLVPQDPNDEPASVLLERIKAERLTAKPEARKERKSTASSTRSNYAEQGGLF